MIDSEQRSPVRHLHRRGNTKYRTLHESMGQPLSKPTFVFMSVSAARFCSVQIMCIKALVSTYQPTGQHHCRSAEPHRRAFTLELHEVYGQMVSTSDEHGDVDVHRTHDCFGSTEMCGKHLDTFADSASKSACCCLSV